MGSSSGDSGILTWKFYITFVLLTLGFLKYSIILVRSRFEPGMIVRESWTLLFISTIAWISAATLLYALFKEDSSCRIPPFAKVIQLINYAAHLSRLLRYVVRTKDSFRKRLGRYFNRKFSSIKSASYFGLVHMTLFVISEIYRDKCGPNIFFVALWAVPNIVIMTALSLKLYFLVPWNNGDIFKISREIKAIFLVLIFNKATGILLDIVLGSASTRTNIMWCIGPIMGFLIIVVLPIHTVKSTKKNRSLIYASVSSGKIMKEKTLYNLYGPLSIVPLIKRENKKVIPLDSNESGEGTQTRAHIKLGIYFQEKASFAEIMQSSEALTLAHEFAAKSLAAETTLFLQDAHAYKSEKLEHEDSRYNSFMHIFNTYVKHSAHYEVNISYRTSQNLHQLAANPPSFQSLSRGRQMKVFDEALVEVEEMFWDNLLHYTSENVRKHYAIKVKSNSTPAL